MTKNTTMTARKTTKGAELLGAVDAAIARLADRDTISGKTRADLYADAGLAPTGAAGTRPKRPAGAGTVSAVGHKGDRWKLAVMVGGVRRTETVSGTRAEAEAALPAWVRSVAGPTTRRTISLVVTLDDDADTVAAVYRVLEGYEAKVRAKFLDRATVTLGEAE